MEIHAPKAPHSLKEFLRELITITAGILVALSLEGVIEWNHHRHLVRESRENIHTEIYTSLGYDLIKIAPEALSERVHSIMKWMKHALG